jgi:hypothetical protein
MAKKRKRLSDEEWIAKHARTIKAKRKRLSDEEWIAKHARTIKAKRKRAKVIPRKPAKRKRAKVIPRKPAKRKRPKVIPRKPAKRKRPKVAQRKHIPFAKPHTVKRLSEEIEKAGYYIVIHAFVMGGWETESTPVFYEEADTAQFHAIIWRTRVFFTEAECIDAYLDLVRTQRETGIDEKIGVEFLWSELRILYPDHTTIQKDKWIGDDVPFYGQF